MYNYIYIYYTLHAYVLILYTPIHMCVYTILIISLMNSTMQYRLQIILQQIAMQYIMLKEIKTHCLIPYYIPRYNILKCPSNQDIKINQ